MVLIDTALRPRSFLQLGRETARWVLGSGPPRGSSFSHPCEPWLCSPGWEQIRSRGPGRQHQPMAPLLALPQVPAVSGRTGAATSKPSSLLSFARLGLGHWIMGAGAASFRPC